MGIPTPGCDGCIVDATTHLLRCLPAEEGDILGRIVEMASEWTHASLLGRLVMLERDRNEADAKLAHARETARKLEGEARQYPWRGQELPVINQMMAALGIKNG